MPTLEDAIILAAENHQGQTDQAGQSYILHPLAVMLRMNTETERIAAPRGHRRRDPPGEGALRRLGGRARSVRARALEVLGSPITLTASWKHGEQWLEHSGSPAGAVR
jgi:hypothetical protein